MLVPSLITTRRDARSRSDATFLESWSTIYSLPTSLRQERDVYCSSPSLLTNSVCTKRTGGVAISLMQGDWYGKPLRNSKGHQLFVDGPIVIPNLQLC